MQLTATKLKNRICSPFMGVLVILILSTLPYFHDIISTKDGLKDWVPILGIERLLTGTDKSILGYSTYRVFLYTFLIFSFGMVGFLKWFSSTKHKFYRYALLGATISSIYHVMLIVFKLRRTVLNDPEYKLLGLALLFLTLALLTIKKQWNNSTKKASIVFKTIGFCVAFFLISLLPFLHDVITDRNGLLPHIPNLGIEKMLTDENNMVRGLNSYRLLLYLLGIYLFAHIPWIGAFMDSRGSRIRPFLLVPVVLSLYQVIIILMSWRETEFNSPSANLYITLGLSLLLAINFFYNNKVSPQSRIIQKERATIKSNENENR